MAIMLSPHPLRQPGSLPRSPLSDAGRNAQLYFGVGANFTLNHQLTSYQFGAFQRAIQAKMSLRRLHFQDRWIDAFSIVPHAQPEFTIIISEFHFDMPHPGVPAQRLPELSSCKAPIVLPKAPSSP